MRPERLGVMSDARGGFLPTSLLTCWLTNGLLSGLADRLAGSHRLRLPYLVVEGWGGWWQQGSGWGEQRCSVYTWGREVRAPECHGANTDHLKTVRERASHRFTAVNRMDRARFTVKECDGVCVCVCEREDCG